MADPSPSPTPIRRPSSGGAGGSSTASSKGSPTSAFVADPGEPFDPRGAAAEPVEPELEAAPPALIPEWSADVVRGLLEAQGNLAHTLVAVDKESDEWLYTRADLAAIAPPLTRILNRYDATRAAAGAGDEAAVVLGLSGYVLRSYSTRRASLGRQRPSGPQPVSGRAASPGSGPPPAPDVPAGAGLFGAEPFPEQTTEGPPEVEPLIDPDEEEESQWQTP